MWALHKKMQKKATQLAEKIGQDAGGDISVDIDRGHSSVTIDVTEKKKQNAELERLTGKLQKLRDEASELTMQAAAFDDFQSPVSSQRYIEKRLQPAMREYQALLPSCARWNLIWESLLMLCTAATALLSFFEQHISVPIVVATSTSIVSWMKFKDLDSKILRYTSTVRALQKILSWWTSLSDMQRGSHAKSTSLVQRTEEVIALERASWRAKKED